MRKFPSSIFSSSWSSLWDNETAILLRVAIVAGVLLAAGEAISRAALMPVGALWEYWNPDAALKFQWYRNASEPAANDSAGPMPDVLVVGDSTAARNFDPAALKSPNGPGVEAFNLGWPANFPLAFEYSTIPLLRDGQAVPRVVVVSFSPSAFVDSETTSRFESTILQSAYCRRQREGSLLQDFVWLTRIRPALEWRGLWFTGKQPAPPANNGFQPLEGHENRSEPDRSREARQLTEARLDVLRDLVTLASERDFQLVIVIPPIENVDTIPEAGAYRRAVEMICNTRNCHVVDCSDVEGLTSEHFWNNTHLNRDGAEVFSHWFSKNVLSDLLAPAGR